MKKNIYFLLILSVVMCGCAAITMEVVEKRLEKWDLSNGVNAHEAVLLAQKYLLENNMAENHNLRKGRIKIYWPNDHIWWVDFPSRYSSISKKGYQFTMQVWVDSKTGEVKKAGVKHY